MKKETLEKNITKATATVFNYLESTNPKDSGKYGKAYEIAIKTILNGNRGNNNHVTSKGKTDTTSKGKTYEIKSNCGELNISDLRKKDYVIYNMDNKNIDFKWYLTGSYIMTPHEFIEMLNYLGLIRRKLTTSGKATYAIQTYSNSIKKKNALALYMLEHFNNLENYLLSE